MSKFALLFLILFFGGLIGAVVSSPVFAVILYQLVYFMNPESRWWAASIPNLSYSFITVVVMIVTLLMHYSRLTSVTKWQEQPVFKWIYLLLLIYLLMGFVAVVPEVHSTFAFNFFKTVIVLLLVYKLIETPKLLDCVIWAYIIGAAYIGYYAGLVGRDSSGRVEGIGMIDTGGDSNNTAASLVPAIIMLLYYVWLGNYKVRILCVICAVFVVNGLVLINSRGAFIGCVIGAAFFLGHMIFSKQQKKGQKLTAYGVIIFGLAGALSLTDQTFWERMATLKDVEDGEASGSHRTDFWLATFDVMKDHPFGVGINGFEALSQLYLPAHYFVRGTAKAVHSSWFQLLAETGWIGIAVFFFLMLALFKIVKKTKLFLLEQRMTDRYFHVLSLQAAMFGYFGAATFINRIRAESMWWCILFLMIASNIYYLQYQNRHRNIEQLTGAQNKTGVD